MYPGSTDCVDAQAMALLRQHVGAASHLSAQRARELGMSRQPIISTSLSSFTLPRGLSSSEGMQTTSLQDRERILAAELLKHREEQLATAIALASRNKVFSEQQYGQNEDLILKRAISQLSPMHQRNHTAQVLGNGPVYRAEQDLSLEKDICFGRGQRVQRRKANVAFRKIVATHQETYDQAESREDKKFVVKKVARVFSRAGYRFFKETEEPAGFGDGNKLWVAVSDHHVEYKIGHSFRSGRKQLKQQKNQRNDKEDADADTSAGVSNEAKSVTSQTKSITPSVAVKPSDAYEESELSDKCVCIGDKREKYTSKVAYQYFRGFVQTFKSILGMTDSLTEKTKIVSGLIDQMKVTKGYKFLKLTQLNTDVEFWIEASIEDIASEVFSIINDQAPSIEQSNQKRSIETYNKVPNKRQCVSTDNIRTNALKRIGSDKVSASPDSKGKRGLANGFPSEIICKPNIEKAIAAIGSNSKRRNSAFSEVQRDTMSAISSQDVRIPPSLISPDVVLGQSPIGKKSTGALERALEMLRGAGPRTSIATNERNTIGHQSVLQKAFLAMQPSIHHATERSMARNTTLALGNHGGMNEKLMQHLRQQELLLFEKKHKLALLELQMQARHGGI